MKTYLKRAKYRVRTWNPELERFTPQKGVRVGPWTKWGLRIAFRQLRALGYRCRRDDPAVLVEKIEH